MGLIASGSLTPRVSRLGCPAMATKLDKTLKREITIDEKSYIVTIDPEGLKLTEKGRRKGPELKWKDIVSGDAALSKALNASVED